jgi:hypothetical protein
MTRSRIRRIVRRAKIEAIVDRQTLARKAEDCAVCTAICAHRVPYSIDAAVDDECLCASPAAERRLATIH